MFKKADTAVRSGLLYVRNATIIISVFITIFYLFAYFMNKDKIRITDNGYERNRQKMYELANNPELQKTDFGKFQISLYRTFLCSTLGETCTNNPDEAQPFIDASFVSKVSSIFVSPYASPPASGVLWTYEGIQKAGFIPASYAQGVGFYSLQPLAPIWKIFRNVSYLILVLIVVTIGFMIMFRANIDPQTVIKIENAIPRIVLTLILVTFSFPIAGFLIDVMYLIMGLGGSIIIQNMATTPQQSVQVATALGWDQDIYNTNGWSLMGRIVGNGDIWKSGAAILSLVPYELQLVFRGFVAFGVSVVLANNSTINGFLKGDIVREIPFLGGLFANAFSAVIGYILFGLLAGILFPIILSLMVYITTLFLFFRIFFLLFITYTKIILSVIFSPIILIFEAFPERGTFAYWIKGLFFNLLTFPIVAILLLTAGMIANVSSTSPLNVLPNTPHGEIWRPPFLYSIEAEGFVMLVAISIIFLIPDMIEFVKKSFGVEDLPFNITPGKLLSGSGAAVAGATGLFFRARSLASEFGLTQETIAADNSRFGFLRPFKGLFAENPYAQLAETLRNRSNDDNQPPSA